MYFVMECLGSGQSYMECGARCVLTSSPPLTISNPSTVLSGTGQRKSEPSLPSLSSSSFLIYPSSLCIGTKSTTLLNQANSFCYPMHGRSWYKGGEHCGVELIGTTWTLNSTSGQSYFECGAQCASGAAGVTVDVTGEVYFRSKLPGTVTRRLPMKDLDGFCFIVDGQSWFESGGELAERNRTLFKPFLFSSLDGREG